MAFGVHKKTKYHKERLKGKLPWNKGKKMSKSFREKVSKARKGKKLSEEHKRNISISAPKGLRHHNWKGGRTIKKISDGYGYILIRMPNHPFVTKNGYVREHRLVMEKKLGRYLESGEVVHHIDGNKMNNKPKNLALYHSNLFGKHMKRVICPECGHKF